MQILKTTFVLLLFVLVSCKQDPKAAAKTPDAAVTAAVAPEIILYCVNVENLQLRDQPALTGTNVITKFQEGDFVTGTGEKSPNKVEVDLRGIPYTDHFYKVTSTTPEEFKGWAFAGALTPVYSGVTANSPDLGKLSQLAMHFKSLNTKDLKSGKSAWDFVTTHFSDAKGPLADAAYILLNAFLSRMEYEGEFYAQAEKVKWATADYDAIYAGKFDMNKFPLTKSFAENGFRLETAEGSIFPVADWQRFYDFFGAKVTPAFKVYLDQELLEYKEPASEDAGLRISLTDLAVRAVFWEQFNKDNPHFVFAERTQYAEQWMRGAVIGGMDNTPIFDYESKSLSAEYKTGWAEIIQKYPGTALAAKCKEASDVFAANGWKYNETVEKWHIEFVEKNAQ